MLYEIVLDAILDCVRMLPFLFAAFLILETIEHYAQEKMERMLSKVQYGGPLVGALLGCIPQCGFSIIAASLYSGGVVTLGTLLSVFIATSDEAVLILLGHPGSQNVILPLLGVKIVIAVLAGYCVDFLSRRYKRSGHMMEQHNIEEICMDCGCHESHGILRPALRHTMQIFGFLLIVTVALNMAIAFVGVDRLAAFLWKDSVFQPFWAALIGMIPNCAASVLLTELYMQHMISFASAIAGLSTGAGLGLLVLFQTNHHRRENGMVVVLLYAFAVLFGVLLEVLG